MLFTSYTFLAFFLVVCLANSLLGRRSQNALLLAASYCFYGYWNAKFLILILISTAVDYACGRLLETASQGRARLLVATSVVVNLGILATFKYYGFFVSNLEGIVSGLGLDPASLHLELVLPVGISFYTFQTLSYTVDVYRKQIPACRSALDFALYVAFFPQLVAGPIERGSRFLPQIQRERRLSGLRIRRGLWLILQGYYRKLVLANNLAPPVAELFDGGQGLGVLGALTAGTAFALQIYGDFSGYSLIARGLAALLGFDLVQNFRQPYFALNPRAFWQRWHMSLSTWLRDYLYIPLGGNRGSPSRTLRNLMITMILGGLWHGAAWNFVLWGVFHGALLALHRLLTPALKRVGSALPTAPWAALRWLVFWLLLCFGWILFRINDLSEVPLLFSSPGTSLSPERLLFVWGGMALLALPVLVIDLAYERRWAHRQGPGWTALRAATHSLLMTGIVLCSPSASTPFIYFQF